MARCRVPHMELVELLDDDGTPCGVAPKSEVHTATTPLHRAFSSYLTHAGRILLTRRALTKRTWPGVWTNTACGHPAPGESDQDAVRRRLRQELGLRLPGDVNPTVILPTFRYEAWDVSGIHENEHCPVYTLTLDDQPDIRPEAAEVCETTWVTWETLQHLVAEAPAVLSPWCVLQVRAMTDAGLNPTSH